MVCLSLLKWCSDSHICCLSLFLHKPERLFLGLSNNGLLYGCCSPLTSCGRHEAVAYCCALRWKVATFKINPCTSSSSSIHSCQNSSCPLEWTQDRIESQWLASCVPGVSQTCTLFYLVLTSWIRWCCTVFICCWSAFTFLWSSSHFLRCFTKFLAAPTALPILMLFEGTVYHELEHVHSAVHRGQTMLSFQHLHCCHHIGPIVINYYLGRLDVNFFYHLLHPCHDVYSSMPLLQRYG